MRFNNVPIKEYFSVSKKYSFKRAVFIIIEKMSKPNTLFHKIEERYNLL